MAVFPGAVKTFTSKSDGAGNKIFAAHINDLQDEVNAIENTLLNAAGPLSLSSLTAATLAVTGASSFAGAATFVVRPTTPPPEAARVYLGAAIDMGTSVTSTMIYLGEEFKTNSSIHSTSANPERLTPQSTGIYLFTAQVALAGVPSAESTISLTILDSSGGQIARQFTITKQGTYVNASGLKRFDAVGGYGIVVVGNQGGGSTMSISSNADRNWFSMTKL